MSLVSLVDSLVCSRNHWEIDVDERESRERERAKRHDTHCSRCLSEIQLSTSSIIPQEKSEYHGTKHLRGCCTCTECWAEKHQLDFLHTTCRQDRIFKGSFQNSV